jgi:hypothetical protein
MVRSQSNKRPMDPEPIVVTLLVVDVLESLQVPYFVVGSLASAVYGVTRATMDADLVADLRTGHAEPLAHGLGNAFYADPDTIRDAILRRSSFNVIHLATAFKVDMFVCRDQPYDREQLRRRTPRPVGREPGRMAYFATVEDTVLSKLVWYRAGGDVSQRQWADVVGMLRVQRGDVDGEYLRAWAQELGLANLLERAVREARSERA